VKLTKLALFAAGYVLGAKADRERYAQIVHGAERASEKLEAFSSRHPPSRQARRLRSS
jgi:hypothetical protein